MTEAAAAAIALRPAETKQALQEITALAHAIWWEHYPGIISSTQIDHMLTRSYAVPVMQTEIANGTRYVLAERDGQVAGFAAHGPDPDKEQSLWLHKLYVAAGHRRRGVAERLLNDALIHAADLERANLKLRVNRGNRLAIKAYRRLGFRIVDTDIADIGGGFVMDDYIMQRPVTRATAS